MNDNSPMPFGIHEGIPLGEVPDSYLLWLIREGKCFGALKNYLEENEESITQNAEQ